MHSRLGLCTETCLFCCDRLKAESHIYMIREPQILTGLEVRDNHVLPDRKWCIHCSCNCIAFWSSLSVLWKESVAVEMISTPPSSSKQGFFFFLLAPQTSAPRAKTRSSHLSLQVGVGESSRDTSNHYVALEGSSKHLSATSLTIPTSISSFNLGQKTGAQLVMLTRGRWNTQYGEWTFLFITI